MLVTSIRVETKQKKQKKTSVNLASVRQTETGFVCCGLRSQAGRTVMLLACATWPITEPGRENRLCQFTFTTRGADTLTLPDIASTRFARETTMASCNNLAHAQVCHDLIRKQLVEKQELGHHCDIPRYDLKATCVAG